MNNDGFRSNPINISQPKKKIKNQESVEDFLKRGGKINKIERGVSSDKNLDKRLGASINGK